MRKIIPLVQNPYSVITLVLASPISIALCLQWYNGLKTSQVHSSATKRTTSRTINIRPTVDDRSKSVGLTTV